MLALGMIINDFAVTQIAGQTRQGRPDGAVILAVRESDGEHVTARVEQHQLDADGPVTSWGNGHYYTSKDSTGSGAARAAMRDYLDQAGLTDAYTAVTVRRSEVTPQSTRALAAWLDKRGPGEEITAAVRELHAAVVTSGGNVRVMIERVG